MGKDKPNKIEPVKVSVPAAISNVAPVDPADLPQVEMPDPKDPIDTPSNPVPPKGIELKWWQRIAFNLLKGPAIKYIKSLLLIVFSLVPMFVRDPETGKIQYGKDGKPLKTALGTLVASAIGLFMTTSYASYVVFDKTVIEWIRILLDFFV